MSTGVFLLVGNTVPINNQVLAVNPPSKTSAVLGKDEFYGDDGKRYTLGGYKGRGNQSHVFGCTDSEGHKYIVKVPLSELFDKKTDEHGQPNRDDVLEILRHSMVTKNQVAKANASTPPPPAPKKGKPTSRLASDPSFFLFRRKLSFGDDDLPAPPVKRDRSAEPVTELAAEPVRVHCVSTTAMPKPDSYLLHETVIDSSVRRILKGKQPPFASTPASFCPYVESDLGITLDKYMQEGQFPKDPDQFNRFVAEAIDHVLTPLIEYHRLNLCHRDVKLENIFIDSLGIVRLGDIGAMRCFNDCIGNPVGTPGYMAPEVWSSYSRDPSQVPKSDIFSLGIVALELLTSDFTANLSQSEEFYRDRSLHIAEHINDFHMRATGERIPGNWQAFLRGCLNQNPMERLNAQDAQEMLRVNMGKYLHP